MKWMTELTGGTDKTQAIDLENDQDSSGTVIALDELTGAFGLLTIGLSLSIIVYVISHLHFMIKGKYIAKKFNIDI